MEIISFSSLFYEKIKSDKTSKFASDFVANKYDDDDVHSKHSDS